MSRVLKGCRLGLNPSSVPLPGTTVGPGGALEPEEDCEAENMARDIVKQAEEEARLLLAEAQEQADHLLGQVREEAEVLRAQAQQEGSQEGYRQGEKKSRALVQQAEEAKQQAWQEKEAIVAAAEPEILALALGLAEKVIRHQLDLNPQYMAAMLRALPLDQWNEEVVVCVPPHRLEYLRERQDLLQGVFPQGGFRLEGVEDLEEGLVLETSSGTIDATVDGQLRELARALGEALGGR